MLKRYLNPLPITEFKPYLQVRLIYPDSQQFTATLAKNIIREKFSRFSIGVETVHINDPRAFSKLYAEDFFRKYLYARCVSSDGSPATLPVHSPDLELISTPEKIARLFKRPRKYVIGLRSVRLGETNSRGYRQVRSISLFDRGIIMSVDWMRYYPDADMRKLLLTSLLTHQLGQLFVPGSCSDHNCIRAYDVASENFFATFPEWFCTSCLSVFVRIKQNH